MDNPESHTPQVSKRALALLALSTYFERVLTQHSQPAHPEAIAKLAEQMAVQSWKIVKKAEGFEP